MLVTVKCYNEDDDSDIRKIEVDVDATFDQLMLVLEAKWDGRRVTGITYQDEDGDKIEVVDDETVMFAFEEAKPKLYLNVAGGGGGRSKAKGGPPKTRAKPKGGGSKWAPKKKWNVKSPAKRGRPKVSKKKPKVSGKPKAKGGGKKWGPPGKTKKPGMGPPVLPPMPDNMRAASSDYEPPEDRALPETAEVLTSVAPPPPFMPGKGPPKGFKASGGVPLFQPRNLSGAGGTAPSSGDGGTAVALFKFDAEGPKEIDMLKGDELTEVFLTDRDEWLKLTNTRSGQTGYVPTDFVEVTSSGLLRLAPSLRGKDIMALKALQAEKGATAVMLFDFEAADITELNASEGDVLTHVFETQKAEWLEGRLNGKTGFVPKDYVEITDGVLGTKPAGSPAAAATAAAAAGPGPKAPKKKWKLGGLGKKNPKRDSKPSMPSFNPPPPAKKTPAARLSKAQKKANRQSKPVKGFALPPPATGPQTYAVAKYDFVGQADELTFTAGQVILDVRDTDTPNWMVGRIDGGPPGYFQRNYCKVETGVPPTGGVASLPKKNKGPKVAKTNSATTLDVRTDFSKAAPGMKVYTPSKDGFVNDLAGKIGGGPPKGLGMPKAKNSPKKALRKQRSMPNIGTNGPNDQARALFDFEGIDETELNLREGDLITNIMETSSPDWLEGRVGNRKGFFPKNYVEMGGGDDDDAGATSTRRPKQARDADLRATKAYDTTKITFKKKKNNKSTKQPGPKTGRKKGPSKSNATAKRKNSRNAGKPAKRSNTGNNGRRRDQSRNGASNPRASTMQAVALFDFNGIDDTELSFREGDMITDIFETDSDNWLQGTCNGRTGFFPGNHTKPVEDGGGNSRPDKSSQMRVTKAFKAPPTKGSRGNSRKQSNARGARNGSSKKKKKKRKGGTAVAEFDFTGETDDELTFRAGDVIEEVFETESDGWLVGKLGGKSGYLPADYVKLQGASNTATSTRAEPRKPRAAHGNARRTMAFGSAQERMVAKAAYTARDSDELSFEQGDVITLMERVDDQWFYGNCRGTSGMFPADLVEAAGAEIEALEAERRLQRQRRAQEKQEREAERVRLEKERREKQAQRVKMQRKRELEAERAKLEEERAAVEAEKRRMAERKRTESSAGAVRGNGERFIARQAFVPEEDDELPLAIGSIVTVLAKLNRDWWRGEDEHGARGMFPAGFVEPYDASAPAVDPELEAEARALAEERERIQREAEELRAEQERLRKEAEEKREADRLAQEEAVRREKERLAEERRRLDEERQRLEAERAAADEARREAEEAAAAAAAAAAAEAAEAEAAEAEAARRAAADEAALAVGEQFVVEQEFAAQDSDEADLALGEVVTVLNRPNDDWWRVETPGGVRGLVPSAFLAPYAESEEDKPLSGTTQGEDSNDSGSGGGGDRMAVIAVHVAGDDDEVTVAVGDVVTVTEKLNEDWYTVTNEAGESGMIPAAVLGPLGTAKPGALGYRMATDVFEATADDELGLNVDDIVEVLENDDANWWQGRNVETGAVGMFPQDFTVDCDGPDAKPSAAAATPAPAAPAAAASPAGGSDNLYTCVETFVSQDVDELGMEVGDVVKVVELLNEDWWLAELNGVRGMIPVTYVEPYDESVTVVQAPAAAGPERTPGASMYTCTDEFVAEQSDELDMVVGDIIEVIREIDSDWWVGRNETSGKQGMFPASFVVQFGG